MKYINAEAWIVGILMHIKPAQDWVVMGIYGVIYNKLDMNIWQNVAI